MPATIVFSHANGFPAGTYRVLFDVWRDAGWQVAAPGMPVQALPAGHENHGESGSQAALAA